MIFLVGGAPVLASWIPVLGPVLVVLPDDLPFGVLLEAIRFGPESLWELGMRIEYASGPPWAI